jgi:ABC-type branched-subunit amino acid transport system substrate-binding protein
LGKSGKFSEKFDLNDTQLDIKKSLQTTINQNIKAALLIPSVKTNLVAIAVNTQNFEFHTQKLQIISSLALSEKPTLEKGGNAIEGMMSISPCLAKNSDYMKAAKTRWQQEIYWRVATSYDATQALITAIQLSKNPTREEILKNLKSLKLPIAKTSGFGLNWSSLDYHSNAQRKYCLFQIRQQKFEEILEK